MDNNNPIQKPQDPVDWHFEKMVLKLQAKIESFTKKHAIALQILQDYREERKKRK